MVCFYLGFYLKLPWQLGADFFMQNLLDGDPASNTLSFRWVSGIQTKGKNYIARKVNIEKYSNIKFKDNEILNENDEELHENKEYGINKIAIYESPKIKEIKHIIIPTDELNILKDLKVSNCSIFSGYPIKDYNDHLFSEKIHNHIINLTRSCFNDDIYYKDFDIKISFKLRSFDILK